ncbi:MAG: serine/threonine-protein kinase, partial [Candidatus Xenobia bacterium]
MNPSSLPPAVINGRFRLTEWRGSLFGGWRFDAVDLEAMQRPVQVILWPGQTALGSFTEARHRHLLPIEAAGEVTTGFEGGVFVMTARPDARGHDREGLLNAVVGGLDFLHERRQGHGYLVPEAIVRVEGEWKIVGAGVIGDAASAVEAACSDGTLALLPPECLAGRLNRKSDMWSLGVLVAQQPPVAGSFRHDLVTRMLLEAPTSVPEAPAPLDLILRGCLQREPSRRWPIEHVMLALDGAVVPNLESDPKIRPTLRQWNAKARRQAVHRGAVRTMAWTPEGWLSGGDDGRIYRYGDGVPEQVGSHPAPIVALSVNAAGELASAACDGTIQTGGRVLRAEGAICDLGWLGTSPLAVLEDGSLVQCDPYQCFAR